MNNVFAQGLYHVLRHQAIDGADRLAIQDAIRVLEAIIPVGECYRFNPRQLYDEDLKNHVFLKMANDLKEGILKAGLVETEVMENRADNEVIFKMTLNVLDVKRAREAKFIPVARFPRGFNEVANNEKGANHEQH